MRHHSMRFSTFLKLLQLSKKQKKSALRRFSGKGGYNFWFYLQSLASEVIGLRITEVQLSAYLAGLGSASQRQHTQRALSKLVRWAADKPLMIRPAGARVSIELGDSGLRVVLDPEIAFAWDGVEYLMQIWATAKPTLSNDTLSMGLFFFREFYGPHASANSKFLLFDAVRGRPIHEDGILPNAEAMLRREVQLLDDLWAELTEPEDKTGPGRSPDDRPGGPPHLPPR